MDHSTKICSLLLAAMATSMCAASAAAVQAEGDVSSVGPGVTPPKLISKIEPKYTRAALDAHIQGTVLLELIIDKNGHPSDINVVSPMGFGLDEKAVEAVTEWRFKPGTKDGHPVNIRAHIEVNFRLLGVNFDQKAEERRTRFNTIMSHLHKEPNEKPTEQELTDLLELSKRKLPGAEYVTGVWQVDGDNLPKNILSGLSEIQKAAEKNYGPALFFIAKAKLQGTFFPQDLKEALSMMRDAALLGSTQAQFTLGDMYEKGDKVEADPNRAKRNFRLCAASGTPECQVRLASLLLRAQHPTEQDQVQAVAWLELAKDHGLPAARAIADSEAAKLTAEQKDLVARLKLQLERKP